MLERGWLRSLNRSAGISVPWPGTPDQRRSGFDELGSRSHVCGVDRKVATQVAVYRGDFLVPDECLDAYEAVNPKATMENLVANRGSPKSHKTSHD